MLDHPGAIQVPTGAPKWPKTAPKRPKMIKITNEPKTPQMGKLHDYTSCWTGQWDQ